MNTTEGRSYRSVLAEYRREHGILNAYHEVLEELTPAVTHPITEPGRQGHDVHDLTRRALLKIDTDPITDNTVTWARAYIRQLEHEIRSQSDAPEQTPLSVVLDHWMSMSDIVPEPDNWVAEPHEDRLLDAEELVRLMDSDMLTHVVELGIPALLAEAIHEDAESRYRKTLDDDQVNNDEVNMAVWHASASLERWRGKRSETPADFLAHLRTVAESSTRVYTPAEAEELIRTAAEGGDPT